MYFYTYAGTLGEEGGGLMIHGGRVIRTLWYTCLTATSFNFNH